jgi:hypothetical protein
MRAYAVRLLRLRRIEFSVHTGVKHRLSPQSVHVPLFGNFTVVGGFLLSMLFIANVFLPATLVDGGSQTHRSRPALTISVNSPRLGIDPYKPLDFGTVCAQP